MRISFIGYKNNSVNLFNDLGKLLQKRISGVELASRFVPLPEDIPIVALEECAESQFIFVFALLDEEDQAEYIKKKLIDVEIASKTRILKHVEADSFSSLDEQDYEDRKEVIVKEFADLIVGILFDEKSFEPKDKDYSL